MGDWEVAVSAAMESMLGYHSWFARVLTCGRKPVGGQRQAGSLTGAVASQRVTEAPKDTLSMDGNHALECKRKSQPDCENDGSSRNESWS